MLAVRSARFRERRLVREMAKASGSPVGDEALRSELKRLGFEAGPITESTRRIYTQKLKQLKTKTSDSHPQLKPAKSPVSLSYKQALGGETSSVITTSCSSGGGGSSTASRETVASPPAPVRPSSLPPPPSYSSSNSVISQLLQSLNNVGHLASDTAFLFPGGEVFLASRAVLAIQCHDLLPILYNREGLSILLLHTIYTSFFSNQRFLFG